jgi:hypothetical protein
MRRQIFGLAAAGEATTERISSRHPRMNDSRITCSSRWYCDNASFGQQVTAFCGFGRICIELPPTTLDKMSCVVLRTTTHVPLARGGKRTSRKTDRGAARAPWLSAASFAGSRDGEPRSARSKRPFGPCGFHRMGGRGLLRLTGSRRDGTTVQLGATRPQLQR